MLLSCRATSFSALPLCFVAGTHSAIMKCATAVRRRALETGLSLGQPTASTRAALLPDESRSR